MFILEIEGGKEVLIPERLVLEGGQLPQSFVYYDWVYSIVNQEISDNYKFRVAYLQRSKTVEKIDMMKRFDDIK